MRGLDRKQRNLLGDILSKKQKIEYTEEPLGDFKIVDDFLPPPEELVFREEEANVTQSMSRLSLGKRRPRAITTD